jgi:DNA-binding NarL/FixJ family response regulator
MTESLMKSQANPTKIRTVIAARPGSICDSLRATLTSLPQFEICGIANGGLSTLKLVRNCIPTLLVIEAGLLQDEIVMLLGKLKQEQPEIRYLVVTKTNRQKQILENLGADIVILRSDPTDRLVESLENLGHRERIIRR